MTALDREIVPGAATVYHPMQSAVIGVLVHNEDPTIETCLHAILAERDGPATVRNVLVVASGCTDLTEDIVRRIAAEDGRVRLIVEPTRTGKAGAINLLLRESSDPIVVVVGGDVVFAPGALVRLLEPFTDPSVGMTGARPIPTNARAGIIGNAVHLLWDMHHELSLRKPKLGEAVAFRRVIQTIDPGTLVDEATMEHTILTEGLQLRYVPTAIVRNRGPETLREFLAQRTRIYRGHLALASATGYRVSSMDASAAARAAWRLWRRGRAPHYMLVTMALEVTARAHARLARITARRQTNGIWLPIVSSKRVLAPGHVLRSHHDNMQRLHLQPVVSGPRAWTRDRRAVVSRIRQLVRVDDQVRVARGQVMITLRGDEDGARILSGRLRTEVTGLLEVLPVPTRGARPVSVMAAAQNGGGSHDGPHLAGVTSTKHEQD